MSHLFSEFIRIYVITRLKSRSRSVFKTENNPELEIKLSPLADGQKKNTHEPFGSLYDIYILI